MAARSEGAPRRVLITGVAGFTGRHLAALLGGRGWEVHGTTQGEGVDGVRMHEADLLDAGRLRALVAEVRPSHVVHLAAISFVAHGDVAQIYATNIVGTRNLLAALAAQEQPLSGVLLASSANIYGNTPASPIREETAPQPANDYAVSKVAMEHMASLWQDRLPLTLVRPFNYTGAGQSPNFVVPKIVAAFRERKAEVELGNIDVERDFCDVRDVVDAYRRLLETAPRGVFNICSGRAVSLREVLSLCTSLSGHRLEVKVNPAFVRANDVHRLCGSDERLRAAIGEWSPRPLRDTLAWMLGGSR